MRKRPVILGCFSPQDDATVKCWGQNIYGQLGLGDNSNRGDDPNGPCPPTSATASRVPASCCPHVRSCSLRAEMGANLPSVDLGAGRTAVAVSAGLIHTCALLVRPHLRGQAAEACRIRQSHPTAKEAACCRTSDAVTD